MRWTPLPTGRFTGINWADPQATKGSDPYLIWVEADRFAAAGPPRRWLPVAIELFAGVSLAELVASASRQWLRVPAVYTSASAPQGLRFCTARVGPDFFRAIEPGGKLHKLVRRLELGLPQGDGAGDDPPRSAKATSKPRKLGGNVMGLIDDGVAFAHSNFLRGGKTRVQYLWRQDSKGVGRRPALLGYGHEVTAKAINQAMSRYRYHGLVDESLVYASFELARLRDRVSHGTHVLDLACGPRTVRAQIGNLPPGFDAPPSWAGAGDAASRCNIVAVQLDYDTVADTSGGSMNVHVLDGLMYILSRCARNAQIVVNISFGTLAGPHDGTSLLEAAMEQLLTLTGGRLDIVLAAGNSYQLRTHANLTLAPGKSAVLNWRVQPDDATQSFLELWLPATATGVTVQVTPPGRAALAALGRGQSRMWLDGGQEKPLCALIYPEAVATGDHGTCALLALAPTFSFGPGMATAPAGVWQIKLTNRGAKAVTLDAYIERDDVVAPTRSKGRQSHFEDGWYDTSGNPGSWVDQPDNPSLIRRSGNFNSIATGAKTVSVGGTRISGSRWAHYSPQNPDPDHRRPARPGVVKVPDQQACSDENPALTGLNAAGTRSGAIVRLRGTSDASPQEARRIFNLL